MTLRLSKKVEWLNLIVFKSLGGEVEVFFASKLPLLNFEINNKA